MRWTESKLRLEDVVFFFYFKHRKKCEKMILKGIRGVSSLGELLAILGPSGRGKTTLRTTLGGRLSTGETRGNIDYNNNPLSRTVKRKTGFVAHSNVFYLHLTVTETLVFIALFRLPIVSPTRRKCYRLRQWQINLAWLDVEAPLWGKDLGKESPEANRES